MVKCPHCGSSAQMQRVGVEPNEHGCMLIYKCGCGAVIEKDIYVTEVRCYMNEKLVGRETLLLNKIKLERKKRKNGKV